ncbi:hypothetical protein [Dictyobacter formicarum]|uniref:hypothetical protein n=1 Tax=Dictyobacter formicarum TaxID=2778368 RepID=UPI0019161A0D|nr:hypothetical protein [Dictyobacter formicarum]
MVYRDERTRLARDGTMIEVVQTLARVQPPDGLGIIAASILRCGVRRHGWLINAR